MIDLTEGLSPQELSYLERHVQTATPEQRLMMLFAQLRADLAAADAAFDPAPNIEAISNNLLHAQQIVVVLKETLDTTVEIGRTLSSVYQCCNDELVHANLKKDRNRIPAVRRMIDAIADANARAMLQESANVGAGV
jgi:flagellar protein FliS